MYGIAGVIRLAAANLQALEFVGILPQHLCDRVTDSGVPHDRTVVLDVMSLMPRHCSIISSIGVPRRRCSDSRRHADSVMPCPKLPVLPIQPNSSKGRSSSSNVTVRYRLPNSVRTLSVWLGRHRAGSSPSPARCPEGARARYPVHRRAPGDTGQVPTSRPRPGASATSKSLRSRPGTGRIRSFGDGQIVLVEASTSASDLPRCLTVSFWRSGSRQLG